MRLNSFLFIFIVLNSITFCQAHQYSNWEEVDKTADEYFAEERYDEAISVLIEALRQLPDNQDNIISYLAYIYRITGRYDEGITFLTDALKQFPDYQYEITDNLSSIYLSSGKYEKCLDIWDFGIQKGFFYLILPERQDYEPLKKYEKFKKVVEINTQRRDKAIAKSKTIYELSIPKNYSNDKKYPLLIALHGGNRTLKDAKRNWNSTKLLDEYIVIYIQSYLHYGMKRFGWKGYDPRARNDIKNIFNKIINQYSVDTTKIIIGGKSAGACTAIDLVINNIIPANGFIAVCPVLPDCFDVEKAKGAKLLGKQGFIIGGEKDTGYIAELKQIEKILKEAEFPFELTMIPNMRHEFPEDFSERLDNALVKIFEDNFEK